MKEGREFIPEYMNVRSFLEDIPAIILTLASTNTILKERGRKGSVIIASSVGCIKIVFALLEKLLTI